MSTIGARSTFSSPTGTMSITACAGVRPHADPIGVWPRSSEDPCLDARGASGDDVGRAMSTQPTVGTHRM
jgi:hypothetical protein